MAFPVVLDACVLIPMPIVDLLLRLADSKQFRPLWSMDILDEVERNLVSQLGLEPAKARKRVTTMRDYFPDAMVSDYESLVPAMMNETKDRHVLAAAVRSGAELIVTDNVRDFPRVAVRPFDISVISADDFLLDQLDLHPARVLEVARCIVEEMRDPRITWDDYLDGLDSCGLKLFAREFRSTFSGSTADR